MSQSAYQYLFFGVMVFALIFCALIVLAWTKLRPKKRKRKHRHHGHGRINPTRAQIGGMPDPRSPGDSPADKKPPLDS